MRCLSPFPQSKDCGPIEASLSWLARDTANSFPQSKDCGPIEAMHFAGRCNDLVLFPQSKDCGPIEAYVTPGFFSTVYPLSAVERLRPH